MARLRSSLDSALSPSPELLRQLYEQMLLMRRFEEKAGQLYGMGLIAGFCHLYIGQEAVVAGVQSIARPTDKVITSYRDHAHMLATNIEAKYIMAELLGRATGTSKGKGGSMHMFDINKHFYGGHGIVGAQVPLGTGLAFADKYRGSNDVTFTYFGDGTAHQGQVYEAFNMAALWKLPVIYIIENNEYAMGTSVARASSIKELYKRGISFNIPGEAVDGMDVLAVRKAAAKAVEYVRAGNGPILLEMKTYRYRGHSMSDPGRYRSKEELENFKENRDPLKQLQDLLLQEKYVDDAWFEQCEKQIKQLITEAVDFAMNSPEPDPSELYTDVYNGEKS